MLEDIHEMSYTEISLHFGLFDADFNESDEHEAYTCTCLSVSHKQRDGGALAWLTLSSDAIEGINAQNLTLHYIHALIGP